MVNNVEKAGFRGAKRLFVLDVPCEMMPVLLERLTLRSSIGEETDLALVRSVALETKTMMLRLGQRGQY